MCGAEQMRKLKDLLNPIGDFHFQSGKDKVDFIGTLVNKDNHVIIQARIEKKNLDCMEQKEMRKLSTITRRGWGSILVSLMRAMTMFP